MAAGCVEPAASVAHPDREAPVASTGGSGPAASVAEARVVIASAAAPSITR
jgi:hypothetical protein